MTPQELEAYGFQRFSWNNGAIIEYWKSIGKNDDDFDFRIAVRFGERKNTPFIVWLFFPRLGHQLKHISTIEQVEQLYTLLKDTTNNPPRRQT